MKTALLIGGTAATGVAIAAELRRLGTEVTIYHRGHHEVDEIADLEHIHGDPHDAEQIRRDLAGRSWDVTVATYGRIRLLAEALRGRTGHFVSISGTPVVALQAGVPMAESHPYQDPQTGPAGMRGLMPRIVETELALLEAHERKDFCATVVRYPYVYGPHSVVPMEWHVMRRVLDGRRRWAVQAGGQTLTGRCAAPNAAHLVGLVLGQPKVSGGQVFHAADSRQYTQREWVGLVAGAMGHAFEFVDIPASVCALGRSAVPMAGEFSWVPSEDVARGMQRHALVSNEKGKRLLGYEDVVDPPQWIARTVQYWQAHPPLIDGQAGRFSTAEFDYESEDRLLAWWDAVVRDAPAFGVPLLRSHPYAHPPLPK